jgi:hypothetical protein
VLLRPSVIHTIKTLSLVRLENMEHFYAIRYSACFPSITSKIVGSRIMKKMKLHSHDFVETYSGLVGFGADRQTDENTIVYYLQKFSDDSLMQTLMRRLSDAELSEIFDLVNRILKRHLNDSEYHQLFLKDEHE